MSNSEFGSGDEEPVVEVFVKDLKSESSIEVPREEWESLISIPVPVKSVQFSLGLFDPGSGEICCKYIAQSSSTVDRHPYFNYPSIKDPGVFEALLHPQPQIIYPDDGQELYLALCQEMKICPIRCFYRQLLDTSINLSYYGIDPRGFRAIAMALKYNRLVKSINFTDNFMSIDGCFHLGEMIGANTTLSEMNLTGCRIGPKGARQLFASLHNNSSLKKLNLSRNELGDEGVQYFADVIFKGTRVTEVDFSHNSVMGPALVVLAEMFETHNKLTHINFSWNKITSPNSIYALCAKLSENDNFKEMRLAWNGLRGQRVANAIKLLMKCKSIRLIDISNNGLCSAPIVKAICMNLPKTKTLRILDLSFNPLTPSDALLMLGYMQNERVTLRNLLMEGVSVDHIFMQLREEILGLDYRRDAVITHGYAKDEFKPTLADMKNLMLSRAQAVCRSGKRKEKPDIAVIILLLQREFGSSMGLKEFGRSLRQQGVTLEEELIEQLGRAFAGPKADKNVLISLDALAEYVKRKWPEAKPPPLPEPVPVAVVETKKNEAKKKKK